ncbi:MAG: tRNA (N6-isopentenyl adenosine(37)-C2)-methylthiotransferase MiaB [Symbiobacteriaceae bacterium]|nr:tRNA (N6-isopentenyl adenosine(37)-C2)-methylthiotransferase MiaB [Symbiobacteriaceae bacterium]
MTNTREAALQLLLERSLMHQEVYGSLPKLFLMTFGCQMNLSDGEQIAGMMKQAGYSLTRELEEADLVVVHTCGVRAGAETRVMGRIGQLKSLKQQKPHLLIAVGGCMTQQPQVAAAIKRVHRHVDLIFGTLNQLDFPQLLVASFEERAPLVSLQESPGEIEEGLPKVRLEQAKAWVPIMFGCDNFCSYCIVPYLRGRERSRQPQHIVAEVTALVKDGVVEVTLLGQNVNSYGKGLAGTSFATLLEQVAAVPGLKRLRFITSHPRDMTPELITTMATYPNICHQLHLPLQAGSSRILQLMNRGYNQEHYLELVEKLRLAMPNLALTTDIIVAYPGESQEDFAETLKVVAQVRFDNAFTFLFSPRPGTPAAALEDAIQPGEKQERMERLMELVAQIAREKNQLLVGTTVEVLVESESKSGAGMLLGRGMDHKVVNFPGSPALIGTLQQVHLTAAASHHLLGELQ